MKTDGEPPGKSTLSASAEQSPLQEFWAFAKDFNSVVALVPKLAAAAPLLDLALNIGPPWPSRITVTTAVVLLQVMALMASFAFWRQGKTNIDIIKRWMLGSILAFVVLFLFLYIPLFAFLVQDVPNVWNRDVRGFELQPPIREFVERKAREGEVWGPRTLIAYFVDATHDITTIWTERSVYTARAGMLVAWLLVMVAYSFIVSAFVAIQYRRLK